MSITCKKVSHHYILKINNNDHKINDLIKTPVFRAFGWNWNIGIKKVKNNIYGAHLYPHNTAAKPHNETRNIKLKLRFSKYDNQTLSYTKNFESPTSNGWGWTELLYVKDICTVNIFIDMYLLDPEPEYEIITEQYGDRLNPTHELDDMSDDYTKWSRSLSLFKGKGVPNKIDDIIVGCSEIKILEDTKNILLAKLTKYTQTIYRLTTEFKGELEKIHQTITTAASDNSHMKKILKKLGGRADYIKYELLRLDIKRARCEKIIADLKSNEIPRIDVEGELLETLKANCKQELDTNYDVYYFYSAQMVQVEASLESLTKMPSQVAETIESGLYKEHMNLMVNDCKKNIKSVLENIESIKAKYAILNIKLEDEKYKKLESVDTDAKTPTFVISTENLICPITNEVFKDPVVAEDGFTYERTAIEEWFKTKDKSPMTNTTVKNKTLIPNKSLQSIIKN